jgi:small-conductance mechanosensitive channel
VYQTRAATLERIPPLIREIIETEPGVRFDRAHFKSFDDCALTFEIVYYVLDPDYNRYMDVQQRVNLAIYRRFKRAGIDFAFPTRTVYVTQPEPTPLAPIGGAGVGS